MHCEECEKKAVTTKPSLCQEHFDTFILNQVQETIDTYELFTKEQTVCVGVSGGKDSLALIDILTRLGYQVEGLFINEGIANYREYSIEDLDKYLEKNNLFVRRVSFEEEAGFSLDTVMKTKKYHACTVCGTLRRDLLNKYANEYEVIATGHNMDDEAQTVLMNLARGNTSLFMRTGPKTLDNKAFTPRVKPLYFVSEKHILTYCVLHHIKTDFSECPYAYNAYRMYMTEVLNSYEEHHPGTKKNILHTYLSLRENFAKHLQQAQEKIDEQEIDHKSASDLQTSPTKAQQLITEINSVLQQD